jgi:toxin secretion/phage lysis holin
MAGGVSIMQLLTGLAKFADEQIQLFSGVIAKLQTVGGLFVGAGMLALSLVDRHLGGVTNQMGILIRLQSVGFLFGVLAALMGRGKHYPTFRSDIGIKGLSKKAAMWGWIWLVHQIDMSLGQGHMVRDALVIGYNVFEAASIAETWINMKWYGHKALEVLLVWRIQRLKDMALEKLKPRNKEESQP